MFIGGAREPSDCLCRTGVFACANLSGTIWCYEKTDDGQRPEHAAATWNTVGVGKVIKSNSSAQYLRIGDVNTFHIWLPRSNENKPCMTFKIGFARSNIMASML